MMQTSDSRRQGPKFQVVLALALLGSLIAAIQLTRPIQAAGTTYYVSRSGNNADGRSWATAWNELNQIKWSLIRAGDTISVDGGSSQMVYATKLAPTASGASGAPITIKLAPDPGRNGQVVIFGGRSTPLPYCDQKGYTYQTLGVVDRGIDFPPGVSWVVIDGVKWKGVTIYGHNRNGVGLDAASSNITIRNVEIYDNGTATLVTDPTNIHYNTWYPDQPGVALSGANNTIDRAIIHDNGQDSFQSNGGIVNFTLSHSWLYNGRTHPLGPDIPWNYCRHSDGIQVYDGGVQSGLTIDSSVLGPGHMHGVILGQTGATFARLNNVTIHNSLFLNDFNVNILGYLGSDPQNWVIDHVTSYVNTSTNKSILGGFNYDLQLGGSNHRITNSVFYAGGIDLLLATNVQASGNCSYNLFAGSIPGVSADPQFMLLPTGNPPSILSTLTANFALRTGSPCLGIGSNMTSVAQLLAQGAAVLISTATPTRSVPTVTRTPTPRPSATPTVRASLTPTGLPSRTPTSATTPTKSATFVPTSTPTLWAVQDEDVYSDALAPGWQSASWNATVNLASTTYVHSGTDAVSYAVTSPYGAFSPYRPAAAVDTSPYTNFRFWVNGQATGGQQLAIEVRFADSQTWGPLIWIDPYIAGGSVVANQWRLVDVPLSVLGASNSMVNRIALQDMSGTTGTAVSVDDIEFYSAAAPTATPTSTVTASLIRTATPTATSIRSSTSTPKPNKTPTEPPPSRE